VYYGTLLKMALDGVATPGGSPSPEKSDIQPQSQIFFTEAGSPTYIFGTYAAVALSKYDAL